MVPPSILNVPLVRVIESFFTGSIFSGPTSYLTLAVLTGFPNWRTDTEKETFSPTLYSQSGWLGATITFTICSGGWADVCLNTEMKMRKEKQALKFIMLVLHCI